MCSPIAPPQCRPRRSCALAATGSLCTVRDLAASNPGKLKEMQDLFLKEAVKHSVLPLDDRLLERLTAAMVGRSDLMAGRTSLTVYQGMTGMSENVSFPKTRSP
jgi:hypothetical protein